MAQEHTTTTKSMRFGKGLGFDQHYTRTTFTFADGTKEHVYTTRLHGWEATVRRDYRYGEPGWAYTAYRRPEDKGLRGFVATRQEAMQRVQRFAVDNRHRRATKPGVVAALRKAGANVGDWYAPSDSPLHYVVTDRKPEGRYGQAEARVRVFVHGAGSDDTVQQRVAAEQAERVLRAAGFNAHVAGLVGGNADTMVQVED